MKRPVVYHQPSDDREEVLLLFDIDFLGLGKPQVGADIFISGQQFDNSSLGYIRVVEILQPKDQDLGRNWIPISPAN